MAKLKSRIRAAARRREKQPRPPAADTGKLEASRREQGRAVEQHLNVLLAIESVLAKSLHEAVHDRSIDDSHVQQALVAGIRGTELADPNSSWLLTLLEATKATIECPDETWQLCLRVAYRSAKTHSKCRPGDFGYLSFVSQFLPG